MCPQASQASQARRQLSMDAKQKALGRLTEEAWMARSPTKKGYGIIGVSRSLRVERPRQFRIYRRTASNSLNCWCELNGTPLAEKGYDIVGVSGKPRQALSRVNGCNLQTVMSGPLGCI